MNVQVTFRHMKSSPASQDYATQKLNHITKKYVSGRDLEAQVALSVEKFHHIANITLGVDGHTFKSCEQAEDMMSAIDLALGKLERQLHDHKDRITRH